LPQLDLYSYKIYDGGTPSTESRGNKNGFIEQGEIIGFWVNFENTGELYAQDVTVELSTEKNGMVINKGKAELGRIEAGKTSKQARFLFTVQRAALTGNLPLKIVLKEATFPLKEKLVNVEILEEGIADIQVARVLPKVGDNIWVGVDLEKAGMVWDLLRNPDNPQIIYLATEKSGVLKSTNGGLNWETSNQGLKDMFILCLGMDKYNFSILYAGSNKEGLFKSEDGGANWSPINEGIAKLPTGIFPVIQTIAVDPPDEQIIYVGTKQGGLYKTTNGGNGWHQVSGLPSPDVRCIALDPKSPETIYVGLGYGGLCRSIDGGQSWNVLFSTNMVDDIANAILSIAVDPNSSNVVYFSRGSGGIYKTTDSGSMWLPVNNGLPCNLMIDGKPLSIYSIEIDPTNPLMLYTAVRGKGIYISRNGGGSWQEYSYGIVDPNGFDAQFISVDKSGEVITGGCGKIFTIGEIKEKKTLSSVNFEFNSDTIKPALYPELDKMVVSLKENPLMQGIIEGHTDNIGSDEYNLDLSKRRAESVKDYLVQKGIPETRLTIIGYGKSKPIVSNETEDSRYKNRRVEILIISPK
ncbi:MAG: OmpA family protein, partial [Candidatus Desantisbacteria bacterium]